jgi:hypothetical protein
MTVPPPDQSVQSRAVGDLPLRITGRTYDILPAEQIDLDGTDGVNTALDQIVITAPRSQERAAVLVELLACLLPADVHDRFILDFKAHLFPVEEVMTAVLEWVLAAYQSDQLRIHLPLPDVARPLAQSRELIQSLASPQRGRGSAGGHLEQLYAELRAGVPAIAVSLIQPEGGEPAHLRLTHRNWSSRVGLTAVNATFCWLTGPHRGQTIAPVDRLTVATVAIAEDLHAPLRAR